MELTENQIERQDYVDNIIFNMINSLLPNEQEIDWDIDCIAQVRDEIWKVIKNKNICSEQEFYPFIEQ